MSRVLVLGATGRAGSAVIGELPADMHLVAGVRSRADVDRLPARSSMKAVLVDLDDPASIRSAADDVETVVSAIRLREDIPPKALVDLHESIRSSAPDGARIIIIGGAGSLHMSGGRRFWEDPVFPARTLPRGIAHARLRDHLESGRAGTHWTYLIPPPAFDPDGFRTGRLRIARPNADESAFASAGAISYADFAVAAVQSLRRGHQGTLLVDAA